MSINNQQQNKKTPAEIEELLNNNPLWAFVYQMATTGRPLRDAEIICLLEVNGLKVVSRSAIVQIRKHLNVETVAKGRVALSNSRRK